MSNPGNFYYFGCCVVTGYYRQVIEIASFSNGNLFASVRTLDMGESSVRMPKSGEANKAFGVFRNACCGEEIIIRKGATFPDCNKHPNLSTVWNEIEVDVEDVIRIKKKANSEPAA